MGSGPPRGTRKVSPSLFAGVLLLPAIFVWFLMRRGYSSRSQAIGVAWLGVIGLVLLLSAPNSILRRTPPGSPAEASPRSWEVQNTDAGQTSGTPALRFELSRTRSMSRMLRTSVKLTNNVGRDLKYVEVFCSYYDGAGTLLGNGMSNWATVAAGDSVTGEVVASGVLIDDVKRRECRARHL